MGSQNPNPQAAIDQALDNNDATGLWNALSGPVVHSDRPILEAILTGLVQKLGNGDQSLLMATRAVRVVDDMLTPSQRDLWRSAMAPIVLQWQDGSSFLDWDLVKLATSVNDTISDDSEWKWFDLWNAHVLSYSATQPTPQDVLQVRGILPPLFFKKAPIFHPLVLFSMRRVLKQPECQAAAADVCEWLVENVFKASHAQVTAQTRLAAGPVIFDLAESHGVKIANGTATEGEPDWVSRMNAVIESVANTSHVWAAETITYQGQDVKVSELVDTFPYWQNAQKPELTAALRAKAGARVAKSLEALNGRLKTIETTLQKEWFSPKFESAANVPLPDRRGQKPFWNDETWPRPLNQNEQPKGDYWRLLVDLRGRVERVETTTKTAHGLADSLQKPYADFGKELQSPWAKAALPVTVLPAANQPPTDWHPLAATEVQTRMAELPFTSTLYDGENGALWRSEAWQRAVKAPDPGAEDMLQAWRILELWDARRGSLQIGDAAVEDLMKALPEWLKGDIDLPPWVKQVNIGTPNLEQQRELDGWRRDLAAFTLLVVWPAGTDADPIPDGVANVKARWEALVERIDVRNDVKSLLAAAWLDLALTQVSGGGAPGIAFPQILNKADLSTLSDWIEKTSRSLVPWEARAGMNALILLARLADAMDDLIIAGQLGSLPQQVKKLIAISIRGLLDNSDNIVKPNSSALPLAFVAADLSRYARTRARGIAPEGGITAPAWLPGLNPDERNAGHLIDKLSKRFKDAPRESMLMFGNGIPPRLLLLAVFQIKLDKYERNRRFTVRAPRPDSVRELVELKQAVRAALCGDEILTQLWPEDGFLPWWQTRYWAGKRAQRQKDVTKRDDRADAHYAVAVAQDSLPAFPIVNWLTCANNDPMAEILMTAATLEAATPPTPPDVPQTGDPGKAALIYDASFLKDIDGRLEGELPREARKITRDKLEEKIATLKAEEAKYKMALESQLSGLRSDDMIAWLKSPLRLSVADFQEQIDAAIAEVRKAEAELDAAHHESLAAALEESASQLLHKAADIELKRQDALVRISQHDQKIAEFETEIKELQAQIGDVNVDQEELKRKIAKKQVEQANLEFSRAVAARQHLVDEIDAIRKVLGDPDNPVQTEVGNKTTADREAHENTIEGIIAQLGDLLNDDLRTQLRTIRMDDDGQGKLVANGQLAAMAVNIEISMGKSLLEDLIAAKAEFEEAAAEERARQRKAKRYAGVAQVCKFIGAAVGAFFGNPALGAEIGAAMAELGIGIAENKSPADILLGLTDNVFAITGAAGYDLEKELNDLGAKGLAEVNELFDSAKEYLGPLMDSLPKVFDNEMLTGALQAFGLDEVPEMATLAKDTFAAFQQEWPAVGEAINAQGGLGGILKNAARFDSAKDFQAHLQKSLVDNVFLKTQGNLKQLGALGRSLGKDINDLGDPDKWGDAPERLSTLVLTEMSKQASSYRSDVVTKWLEQAQAAGKTWNAVEKEGKALLDNFFPNPLARAEVESRLKSALLPPDARRAIMDGWLRGRDVGGVGFGPAGGWMGELEGMMKAIQDPSRQAPASGGSRQAVAEAQVTNLRNALVDYNTALLPFLKGKSNSRDALLQKLKGLEDELALQEYTVEIEGVDVEISKANLEAANISVEQAELYWQATKKEVEISRIGMERATLMTEIAELSKLKEAGLADVQKLSSDAARERNLAAKAMMQAVEANLAARKADLQGKLRRGAEASRIRTGLDRAPLALSLEALAKSEAEAARKAHADALEEALKAYREVQRFYVSVDAPELPLATRPDDLAQPVASPWSTALEAWLRSSVNFEIGINPDMNPAIDWNLTAHQIAALTSKDGLRIIFVDANEETEEPDDDLLLFTAKGSLWMHFEQGGVNEWRAVPTVWRDRFTENGRSLTEAARYLRTSGGVADRITIRDELGPKVEVQTHNAAGDPKKRFEIPQEVVFGVSKEGNTLHVKEVRERYDQHKDRIIEGMGVNALRCGRILGIFLSIVKEDGGHLSTSSYAPTARHEGLVRFSVREMGLRQPVQEALGDRLYLLGVGENPLTIFNEKTTAVVNDGDINRLALQGLPIGGVTALRLTAVGVGDEFKRVRLQVWYKDYKRGQQVAGAPSPANVAVA